MVNKVKKSNFGSTFEPIEFTITIKSESTIPQKQYQHAFHLCMR
jgi:hypothetical protein